MKLVTADLRLDLERQRGYLRTTETQQMRIEADLAKCQNNVNLYRQKITELETAIALLERPRLDVVKGSRL